MTSEIVSINLYSYGETKATIRHEDKSTTEITLMPDAMTGKTIRERFELIMSRAEKHISCIEAADKLPFDNVFPATA